MSITLGPLSPTEHRALVESVVGAPNLSGELATRVYEATEGNPFFTKELLRSLIDSGGIARDDTGAWSFSQGTGISSDALARHDPAGRREARSSGCPRTSRDLLSVASVLGRSFEFGDLEVLAEGAQKVEDSIDRLVREGVFEEERESRGDRLAFSSGIVRDVLYGALSRRKRRSLHRKYAELLEERYAGRLERIYPELVHHFSQADVPEKTVEYGLKLARKSLDAFSADDAIRAAKTALEYLEDEEWSGDRVARGGRAAAARARRSGSAGNADGALREAEAAVRVFERERQPEKAVAAILFAAETAWQARRTDETRRWAERGLEAARIARERREPLTKLLSLAATVANLRGEYPKAAAYLAEIERLDAAREGAGGGRPERRHASSSRWRTPSPRSSRAPTRRPRSTRSSRTSSRPSSRPTRRAGSSRFSPRSGRSRTAAGRSVCSCGRGVVFSDGTPADRSGREDGRSSDRSGCPAGAMPAAFAAISGVDGVPRGQGRNPSRASRPFPSRRSRSA